MQRQSGNRVPVQAVETTLGILHLLQESERKITEIADELDIAKSTAHSHLKTLEQSAYVVCEDNEYRLGYRCLNLGGHVQASEPLYHAAKEEVNELAEETGERCQVMAEQHGRGTYLYQASGERAIQTDSHIGTRVYLHSTAQGKAILAHLPTERVNEVIERHGLPAKTDRTVTTKEELFAELEQIREYGVSYDDGERIKGMRCVAAPICNEDAEAVGAISISGPVKRLKSEYYRETLPEIVSSTARTIEIKTMYS
ncbi:IclR family transcriptional regulator [Halobellus marinus]|uniref:IclR family transcriptional regulator n=1 Tax=Halobellus TaxID=1073986 RepID=UPI0028AA4856|nr:IclR family transcriptional regulator [Halobellus sp. DFY28]